MFAPLSLLSAACRACRRMSTSPSFPPYLLNVPATEVSKLDNGVRVASEDGHGETATVGVYINAGSRYETTKNNGTAHFLEHLNFKGTNKRTQRQLELEFENMGGHLNAYTSREQTVYYAKVFKKDVSKAMETLADILQNSQLDSSAIERERGVILREMEEVNMQHEEVIFDKLHEVAYQGCGLGRTILGPEENIMSITRDDLTAYIKTHYTGPRVVIAGAGAVEHAHLVDLADKCFGKLPSSPLVGYTVPVDPVVFSGAEIRSPDGTIPLSHVAVAVETKGWVNPHLFSLMVLQTLLGQWDRTAGVGPNVTSKLCRTVGESHLAHSLMTFNTTYRDTGLFGVYAVAEPENVERVVAHILNEFARLSDDVSDSEIATARTQLKTTLLSQLDGSTAVCEDIGRQLLTFGRRMTPAELFARVDAIDASSVMQTARLFIQGKSLAVAGLGDVSQLPPYDWVSRWRGGSDAVRSAPRRF